MLAFHHKVCNLRLWFDIQGILELLYLLDQETASHKSINEFPMEMNK